MKPARAALFEGTRADHEALDALFAGFDLADAGGYARFLAAHAEAGLPVEAALDGAGALLPDWPARRRGAALTADLGELGQPFAIEAVPSLTDPAAIAGAVYVLEGSRLGGRVLARGVGPGLPTRYLDAHQEHGAWADLLTRLELLLDDESRRARAVESARAVFARFAEAGAKWIKD
jgi:heme oxygenase (biliverdin-IX-beta and delta-forming)